MGIYTYASDASPAIGTAGIKLASGIVYLGQSGVFLTREVNSLIAQGFKILVGPAQSPFSQISAPVVSPGASGSLTGSYKWCVTFVTDAGETVAGPEFSLTLSSQQGVLSSIPVGGTSSGVIARKIYRTSAGGPSGAEKLVGVLNDNSTTTFVDNVPDGSLGSAVPTVDTSYNSVSTSGFEWALHDGMQPSVPGTVISSFGVTAGWVLTADGNGGYLWAPQTGGGGGGSGVSSFNGRNGAVTSQSGDYVAAEVTNAADLSSGSQQAFTGEVKAPDLIASGLPGATVSSRYVGATTSGPPTSGTFSAGDWIGDLTGRRWTCSVGGSPGTWVQEPGTGAGGTVASFNGRTGVVTAATGDYTASEVTNAADKSSGSQQAFTGEVKASDFLPAGLTGATAASRYAGATVSGAPTSGTFSAGDWIVDHAGKRFTCSVGGSPGTWVQEPGTGGGGGAVSSVNGQTGAVNLTSANVGAAEDFIDTPVLTGAYNLPAGHRARVDISAANAPIQLFPALQDGARCAVKIVAVNATPGTFTATLTTASGDVFDAPGGPTTKTLTALGSDVEVRYHAFDGTWVVESSNAALGNPLGAAKLGTDGTVGGPGGSPVTGGGGGGVPNVIGAPLMPFGSAVNLALVAGTEQWLEGLMNANLTVTVTAFPEGATGRIIAQMDSHGPWQLTIAVAGGNSTVVPIPEQPGGPSFEVDIKSTDGTALGVEVTPVAEPDASAMQKGVVYLSVPPTVSTRPEALGANDPAVPHYEVLPNDMSAITGTTTLQPITGLVVPIGASPTEIWDITWEIIVTGTDTAEDFKWGLQAVPAACTALGGNTNGGTAVAGWNATPVGASPLALLTEPTGANPTTTTGSIAGTVGVMFKYKIFGGGNYGLVAFGIAQANSGSGTIVVNAGSSVSFVRLAT